MATSGDARIAFPPTSVDFAAVVGETGQDHDNFPAAGQQPRYDWMRLYLIGLLAHQASDEPPTQYRLGTVWYNTVKRAFFVFDGEGWVSLSSAIAMTEQSDGSVLSLADWFTAAQAKLDAIQPRIAYNGYSANDNVTKIPIPTTIQELLVDGVADLVHPLVYIDGVLVDPRNTKFNASCPTQVELLNGVNIDQDQRFTVIIESFAVIEQADVIAT